MALASDCSKIYRLKNVLKLYIFLIVDFLIDFDDKFKFESNRTANSIKIGNFALKNHIKSNISLPVQSIAP